MISRIAKIIFLTNILITSPAISKNFVIKNITIIDGTGNDAKNNMNLIIENGLIKSILDNQNYSFDEILVIDGTDKFLIPGLMDVHVHIPGSPAINSKGKVFRPMNRDIGISSLHGFLYNGITSIFDAGNNAEYIIELRRQERNAEIISPRIFATGGAITFPGSWGAGPNGIVIDSWPSGKSIINKNLKINPDLQKITYENFGAGANPWVPTFPDNLIEEIINYLNNKGVRTTIHISDEAHARTAIKSGIDTLAHPVIIGRMSKSFLPLIKESGVSVASTLAVFDNIVRISENPDFLDLPVFQSAYTKEQIKDQKTIARKRYISMGWNNWFKTALFYSMSNIKILHDSGVEIALGTDRAAGPLTHRELELIVEAGIPPLQAIKIGTLNAAKYLSIEKKLGSIEEGKLADGHS